jgi:hypothetical protein
MKIKKTCPFCTITADKVVRCGIAGGSLRASDVGRLPDCPKDMSKYQIKKYRESVL